MSIARGVRWAFSFLLENRVQGFSCQRMISGAAPVVHVGAVLASTGRASPRSAPCGAGGRTSATGQYVGAHLHQRPLGSVSLSCAAQMHTDTKKKPADVNGHSVASAAVGVAKVAHPSTMATGILHADGTSELMNELVRCLNQASGSWHLVFVYGTLKRSFPNSHLLSNAMFVGEFRTVQQYPLVVGGPWFSPYLLNMQGKGQKVKGEVYIVDDGELAKLDELENIGVNYTRKVIPVDVDDGAESPVSAEPVEPHAQPRNRLHVHAYLKCNYTPDLVKKTWLDEYQDRRYVPRHKRPNASPATSPATSLSTSSKPSERVAAVS
ncbi:Gamma-glutamylaminecyclotransferase [Porphyridium purpureum]|uniref:Gamma-glutamylcyclotransferase family protein n=1 Tax=Porphyridium purpureum TaxID=35688 RepID=A0A5J4Z7H7_PORPP|nr:Gamma-glutamylaminecyclotransferase [Porphyridium purpureum]|eukprot:POR5656..scf295_1